MTQEPKAFIGLQYYISMTRESKASCWTPVDSVMSTRARLPISVCLSFRHVRCTVNERVPSLEEGRVKALRT
eukprot:1159274-Pelagomonas_calceolata.AAC.7